MPSTRGDRRAHRPDLPHVRLAVMVEQQAGIPRLMQPRRGHPSAASDVGPVGAAPITPRPPTDGSTSRVAAGALDRAETLQQLAQAGRPWSRRVPATLSEAPQA